MNKQSILCAGFALACLIVPISANCGAATCPLISYTPVSDQKFELGIGYEFIRQDQVYVGTTPSEVGAIHQHHDEKQTFNTQYSISGKYSITPQWRVRVEVPIIQRTHEHIHNHHGDTIPESWNMQGLGDTTVLLDHVFYDDERTDTHFAMSAGIKFATGVTDLKNEDGDEAEVVVQPGSGSTDYNLGLFFQSGMIIVPNVDGNYVSLPLKTGISYFMRGVGKDGWQFGNSVIGMVGTTYILNNTISLGLDGIVKFQDKANPGSTGEKSDNTGGTWIYLAPNAEFAIAEYWSLKTMVQVPVYQNVNGIQLTSPWNLRVDLGLRF